MLHKVRRDTPNFWAMLAAPVLTIILILTHGLTLLAVLYVGFTLLLLILSAIDCDQLILPDALTLPGAALALASSAYLELSFTESLTGAFLGCGAFLLTAKAFPVNLGLGDAKLMLLLGALCGLRGVPVVVATGSACGLALALATNRTLVPFGPFLCLGAYLHMLGVRV